jgi:hypothetical protein
MDRSTHSRGDVDYQFQSDAAFEDIPNLPAS